MSSKSASNPPVSSEKSEWKTVLITGATGQLGRQCSKTFENDGWKVIGTGFSRAKPPNIRKLDLGSEEDVTKCLEEVRPDVIVHCAAERQPDKCEAEPERVKKLNVQATTHLAALSAELDILLIYLSTDYVFPGTPGGAPYTTASPTNPPNFYGETKLAGEKAVLEHAGNRGVILRVPVLYGEVESNAESAVNVLLDKVWNKEGKGKGEVQMDHWSIRYPTNTADVARVIKDIANKYTTTTPSATITPLPRILQFSSEDKMTKYEICQVLADIAGLPLDHMVGNAENDQSVTVHRPYDCHLSTQALKDLGISVESVNFRNWWQRYMRAYKKKYSTIPT